MKGPFRIVIPARHGASRFPGKPLVEIAGRTLLEHVWRRALDARPLETLVATDDARIADVARAFGADVCMTRTDHPSGTDRLAEVAQARGWDDGDIVVNLQGDEPLTPPAVLRQVADNLSQHPAASIATLSTPLAADEHPDDPNLVKVVSDQEGFALYFSRAAIPHLRADRAARAVPVQRHLGIYAYRVAFLRQYTGMEPAPMELAEGLEQLRALWHGCRIHVDQACELPGPGVDVPDDVERVAARMKP